MRSILFILALLVLTNASAQTGFTYNKRFVQSEDKWVAFSAPKDSSHIFGFIYIDAQAGLTFDYTGNFTIAADGKLIPGKPLENGSYKVRLQPNNVQVAWIPAERYAELGIKDPPDWLHNYKETKDSIGRMVRWGYYYNHWNESAKALTYLERAYELDPDYEGLEFELSYAYNALERFQDAITVLTKAIPKKPDNCLYYKELSYAQIHLDLVSDADLACQKGMEFCPDDAMKCEIAYNIAYRYFKVRDKANFERWKKEVKKYGTEGSQFTENIKIMEKEIAK